MKVNAVNNIKAEIKMEYNDDGKYKVKLVSVLNGTGYDARSRHFVVTFETTPSFSESGSVEYSQLNPIHTPGGIQIYKYTPSRTFQIGAKLYSRTQDEVRHNMQIVQLLRSWRMPFFGKRSATQQNNMNVANAPSTDSIPDLSFSLDATETNESLTQALQNSEYSSTKNSQNKGLELLGAPPEVLYLYAYSNAFSNRESSWVNINKVPVVITNLEITYPDDVQYFPSALGNEPFPMRLDINISLAETHSPQEYESFSLTDYKLGELEYF